MRTREIPKPILYEERVYADVFPFVRLCQGLWLAVAVLVLMGLLPLFFWRSSIDIIEEDNIGITDGLGLLIFFIVIVAAHIGISVSICRMSKWLGYFLLLSCASALCFMALLFLWLFIASIWKIATGGLPPWRFASAVVVFIVPYGYICFIGLRAGWRLAFSGVETKRMLSEIEPVSRFPRGWFSKLLAMPVPKKYLRKNRAVTVTLFVVSGVAFSSFAMFAIVTPTLSMAPILTGTFVRPSAVIEETILRTGNRKDDPATQAGEFIFALMMFSPLIFGAIAIAALIVGLVTRRWARRLMISSIRESQEYDARPPILFLRSFRDDQVKLPAPRLPLMGRLANLFQRKGSLDVVLLEEGTAYGPVVAIGEPDEPVPPYGAARGYFTDEHWQDAVARLMDDSRCIVICLDQTKGLLWELREILKRRHEPKTLFVVNPGARDVESNKALMRDVIAGMADPPPELLLKTDEPVLGFFFDEGRHAKVSVSGEFSEASYLVTVRWFLRTAMDGQIQPT